MDKLGPGTNRYTIIYKIYKQQHLLYSLGEYIQYLVTKFNGKESEKRVSGSLWCISETNTTL